MDDLATILARTGTDPDPETGAIAPPLHTASTYARDKKGEPSGGFVYSRLDNPTRRLLENALTEVEGGCACAAFSSGMSAAMTLLQSLAPGENIILPADTYFGVRHLATQIFGRWGLDVSIVDMTDLSNVEEAVTERTKLIWAETPSNPLLNITDVAALSKISAKAGAFLVVDNTWPTPYLTRPLGLGADVVLHSVSKYLGGHSDVLGGALIFSGETAISKRVFELQREAGAVMDPFSCWLTMRGMRTLIPRLDRQCASAEQLARFLNSSPHVARVMYPGLRGHPGHEIAKRQMRSYGGMLSFLVDGTKEQALQVARRTRLFTDATSLGGTESLIEHRASMEGPDSTTPGALLRVSVGLEAIDDLVADMNAVLRSVFV